ncbi:MAG TPA: hypothetical protein VJ978_07645 [Nitriliruptoraceae bacterium]|nr:hypothetical protein [Nitriliruptoraceae bacterium]
MLDLGDISITPPSAQVLSNLDDHYSGLGQAVSKLVLAVHELTQQVAELQAKVDAHDEAIGTIDEVRAALILADKRFKAHQHKFTRQSKSNTTTVTVEKLRTWLEMSDSQLDDVYWRALPVGEKPTSSTHYTSSPKGYFKLPL